MAFQELVPEFYAQWLRPIRSEWSESHLDCLNCTRHEHKCCEYSPFLPNFALGEILKERDRLPTDIIASGQATPIGLFPTGKGGLCPFFRKVDGLCSIWKHRPGVCSAYFCSSSRGEEGLALRKHLETYLNLFEWTLAHETLWRMGFTQDDLRAQNWFEYSGRTLDLYRESAKVAAEVGRADVRTLMGAEGEALEAKIDGLCRGLPCVS